MTFGEFLKEYWTQIGCLAGMVGSYFTLKHKVETLEKEFTENGRVGKLEKYATEFYARTDTLLQASAGQKEINEHLKEDMKEIKIVVLDIQRLLTKR